MIYFFGYDCYDKKPELKQLKMNLFIKHILKSKLLDFIDPFHFERNYIKFHNKVKIKNKIKNF